MNDLIQGTNEITGGCHTIMNRIILFIKKRFHIALLALLPLLLVEFNNRYSFKAVYEWSMHNGVHFFLNYLIVLSIFVLFIAIFGRTSIAFVTISIVLLAVSTISGIKLKYLGLPLLPWDIYLGNEAEDMSNYITDFFNAKYLIDIMLYFLISLLLIFKVPFFNLKVKLGERIFLFITSILIIGLLYTDQPIDLKKDLHVENIYWDQSDNYLTNGFLMSYMMNLDLAKVKAPKGYSQKNIMDIINKIPEKDEINQEISPNVIVVLSEAFWDPTVMKNIHFSEDPLPFYHSLQQKFTSGWLLSPQFGGGTANVEFEILTGNSMRFLPVGSTPSIQYVNRGIDSLASIFTRQGYNASAISAYYNWFYDANKVYKRFGFNNFISSEFLDPNYEGPYLADSEIVKAIIKSTEKTDKPDFVFASTMENHFPFTKDKFKENPIQVDGPISEESKEILEAYCHGINDADKALKSLVDYYSNSSEPTMIVFFGDHLPVLGTDYKVYKESGYIKDINNLDFNSYQKLYKTPLLIWNNFQKKNPRSIYISPSFLGPYILNEAGKKGTAFTDFLYSQYRKTPIIPPESYYKNIHITSNDLYDYRLLQYDGLFGDRFVYQGIQDKSIISDNFHYGYQDIKIETVTPNSFKAGEILDPQYGGTIIAIHGTGFLKDSKIYANGKPLNTTFGNNGFVTAVLPKELLNSSGNIDIQLDIVDMKGKILSTSNSVQVTVN
jgi:phosphoglycerol transferase MdoB-like AlkP superfamily enzyme